MLIKECMAKLYYINCMQNKSIFTIGTHYKWRYCSQFS